MAPWAETAVAAARRGRLWSRPGCMGSRVMRKATRAASVMIKPYLDRFAAMYVMT